MRFSIITPSYRNSAWLKLCIASVADQGVELEHIVQDSLSDDGTLDWLLSDRRVRACPEKDAGMYDAVNRGLKKSRGDILAYLNCDEQYLPGTLKAVADHFERHPEIDVLFADCLVVDAMGECLCYRKVQIPGKYHTLVCHLQTFTCSTFFRRNIIDEHGLFFDAKWRDAGDADWVLRLLEAKIRMGIFRRFTTAFTDTGANMNLSANSIREKQVMAKSAPAWARKLEFALVWQHRLRRLFGGIYRQKAFDYEIYTLASPDRRVAHHVKKPTFVWKSRLKSRFI
ncbi:MAG: glycosyltransferase family 2 protein [Verrucomicrobiota bacterium]|jgi:glycosyltransferase involved in cell wall biosynthesis